MEYLSQAAEIAPLLTAGLVIVGFLSLKRITKTGRQALILGLYGRTMEHNKSIVSDKYQRIAIDIFHDLERENSNVKSNRMAIEKEENSSYELYWATRAVHLSHLFLIYQVWGLADEDAKVFERDYYGWAVFSQKVLMELNGKTKGFETKPDWYKSA